MKVKDLIFELINHCDMDDDIFVNAPDESGEFHFYVVDGLENNLFEYRNNPTIAVAAMIKP